MPKESNPFEVLERERVRVRIFPEKCPERHSEVDFEKARYQVAGKEFRFVARFGIENDDVDLSLVDSGVEYLVEPGAEDLINRGIIDFVANIINEVNKKVNYKITRFRLNNNEGPFNTLHAGRPGSGFAEIPAYQIREMSDEEIKQFLKIGLFHEAGHLDPKSENDEFRILWEEACKLEIVDWFTDGDFVENKPKWSENMGHPSDDYKELFASAFMIFRLFKNEFDDRFYDIANPKQKALITDIFKFVSVQS